MLVELIQCSPKFPFPLSVFKVPAFNSVGVYVGVYVCVEVSVCECTLTARLS